MTMNEKYKVLLQQRGVKTAEVSRKTGIPYSTLNEWAKGKTKKMSPDNLTKLSAYFNVPISYFYMPDFLYRDGDFEAMVEKFSDSSFDERMEHYMDVAAGQGRINEEYEQPNLDAEYSTVRICGDSMLPTLHYGDVVKVHHITNDIKPTDFAIVKINGNESTCKHIEVTAEGIWLRAENKEVFADKFYSIHDVLTLPVSIIGIAEEIISRRLV